MAVARDTGRSSLPRPAVNGSSTEDQQTLSARPRAVCAAIGGRLYAFAARNPLDPALLIFDVTDYAP